MNKISLLYICFFIICAGTGAWCFNPKFHKLLKHYLSNLNQFESIWLCLGYNYFSYYLAINLTVKYKVLYIKRKKSKLTGEVDQNSNSERKYKNCVFYRKLGWKTDDQRTKRKTERKIAWPNICCHGMFKAHPINWHLIYLQNLNSEVSFSFVEIVFYFYRI